jgi:hypothetical protein
VHANVLAGSAAPAYGATGGAAAQGRRGQPQPPGGSEASPTRLDYDTTKLAPTVRRQSRYNIS